MKPASRIALLILATIFLAGFSDPAAAAMGNIQSFAFRDAESDLLGMNRTMSPDGRPDAHFVVSARGIGALTGISLKAVGTDRGWDTNPGSTLWGMVVRDDKGENLTSSAGSLSRVSDATPLRSR